MKYLLIIIILLLVFIYLNRSYSYFYYSIGHTNLQSPFTQQSLIIGNENKFIIKYIALGDSLSSGVGSSDYTFTLPYFFAQKLNSKYNAPVQLINLSKPGSKTSDLINNQLNLAISQNPNYITLFIGINDIHNHETAFEFGKSFEQIILKLKTTSAIIYVFNLPLLGSNKIVYFPYNFVLDFQTKQYNNQILLGCQKFHLNCIDIYSPTKIYSVDSSFYSADNFHPSQMGYSLWSQLISI